VPAVKGSVNQLQQVVVNLIVNAIDAVGDVGLIRVSAARDRDKAVICVEDDGPGIPPDVCEHLFEPFFTTKAVGAGTGLGLYISYEIVKNHGGEILVHSDPGRRTAFEIRLPIDDRHSLQG
jgi:signal transduction histidine kinase